MHAFSCVLDWLNFILKFLTIEIRNMGFSLRSSQLRSIEVLVFDNSDRPILFHAGKFSVVLITSNASHFFWISNLVYLVRVEHLIDTKLLFLLRLWHLVNIETQVESWATINVSFDNSDIFATPSIGTPFG